MPITSAARMASLQIAAVDIHRPEPELPTLVRTLHM
jgi:hypothetical protein